MLRSWTWLESHLVGEEGAGLAEYGLLAILIAIVALLAVQFAGGEVSQTYSEIGSGLEWANDQ